MNIDYRTRCYQSYKAVIKFSKNNIADYIEGYFTFSISNLSCGGFWSSRIDNGQTIANYLNIVGVDKSLLLSARTPNKYIELMKNALMEYLNGNYANDNISDVEFNYQKVNSIVKKPNAEQMNLFI